MNSMTPDLDMEMDMTTTISPSQITSSYFAASDLPTPPSSSASDSNPMSPGDKPKRKRKSWGQPIPDYQPILPPGKRAKTEEEKEQRRCERIVRNRKAAATSRDRKKHEFERLEQENKILRDQIEQQSQIIKALQSGQDPSTIQSLIPAAEPVAFTSSLPPTPPMSASNSESGRSNARSSSPVESVVSLANPKHTSPTLTPSLFVKGERSSQQLPENPMAHMDHLDHLPCGSDLEELINNTINDPQRMLQQFTNFDDSSETRYPAVVLCNDLQCLPESSEEVDGGNSTRWINSILIIQLVVLNAMSNISSEKMLSAMSQILTSLEQILPRLQACPKTLDMIFPLIHSLITLPSTENTSRRAFRMAFLRRLLSSSPVSARLIDDATARALQQLSSAEAIQESPRDGLSWASLLTIRWAIRRIEREKSHSHQRFNLSTRRASSSSSSSEHLAHSDRSSGVDYVAHEATVTNFQCQSTPVTSAPNVH